MRRLFVGGPMDGLWRDAPARPYKYAPEPARVAWVEPSSLIPYPTEIREYVPATWMVPGWRIPLVLMVEQGLWVGGQPILPAGQVLPGALYLMHGSATDACTFCYSAEVPPWRTACRTCCEQGLGVRLA